MVLPVRIEPGKASTGFFEKMRPVLEEPEAPANVTLNASRHVREPAIDFGRDIYLSSDAENDSGHDSKHRVLPTAEEPELGSRTWVAPAT